MRISKALIDALAKGWRNIDAYTPPVGKIEHAEQTIKALRDAGYVIHKVKKTRKPVKASGSNEAK